MRTIRKYGLVPPTRTHACFVHEVRRGGGEPRPRRPRPAARAHETRVTGPLDHGRAASAPGRRGGGPASLAPRARLPGCAGQRSRHPLSAASPARGSRRCRGPYGGRCPGRRGVGAPAVDCTRHQGDESRRGGGDRHEPRTPGCRVVADAGVRGDTPCICRNDAGYGGPVSLRSTRSVHGSAHAASRSIFLRRSRSASREATAVPATLVSRARSSRGISCWSANTMTDSNVRP